MSPYVTAFLALFLMAQIVSAVPPYFYDAFQNEEFPMDGLTAELATGQGDADVDRFLQHFNKKKSCLRRGARCDGRPESCCSGGACRCNLWGTNCQCQRMGIFQKWG